MAFEKPRGGGNFFRVSCGKFVGTIDGEERKEVAYTGYLRSIKRFTDEYKGEENEKIEVVISDGDENIRFQFTLEAWYAVGFFQRIRNIDLAEKFTLGVMESEQNEKISFCWMKQAGKKIERDEKFPAPEKKTVGKKVYHDWEAVVTAADKEIARIQKAIGQKQTKEEQRKPEDLPF